MSFNVDEHIQANNSVAIEDNSGMKDKETASSEDRIIMETQKLLIAIGILTTISNVRNMHAIMFKTEKTLKYVILLPRYGKRK